MTKILWNVWEDGKVRHGSFLTDAKGEKLISAEVRRAALEGGGKGEEALWWEYTRASGGMVGEPHSVRL